MWMYILWNSIIHDVLILITDALFHTIPITLWQEHCFARQLQIERWIIDLWDARTHAHACAVTRATREVTIWHESRSADRGLPLPSSIAVAGPSCRLLFPPSLQNYNLLNWNCRRGHFCVLSTRLILFSFILLKRPLCLLDPLSKSPSFMDTSLVLLSLSLSCFPNRKWQRSYDNVRVSSESAEFRCIWLKPFCFLVIMWGDRQVRQFSQSN